MTSAWISSRPTGMLTRPPVRPSRSRAGKAADSVAASAMAAWLARRFPCLRAQVGADGVHAVEMLGNEVHVVHRDAKPLLDEEHQPQQAQRVENARLEQRRVV